MLEKRSTVLEYQETNSSDHAVCIQGKALVVFIFFFCVYNEGRKACGVGIIILKEPRSQGQSITTSKSITTTTTEALQLNE